MTRDYTQVETKKGSSRPSSCSSHFDFVFLCVSVCVTCWLFFWRFVCAAVFPLFDVFAFQIRSRCRIRREREREREREIAWPGACGPRRERDAPKNEASDVRRLLFLFSFGFLFFREEKKRCFVPVVVPQQSSNKVDRLNECAIRNGMGEAKNCRKKNKMKRQNIADRRGQGPVERLRVLYRMAAAFLMAQCETLYPGGRV